MLKYFLLFALLTLVHGDFTPKDACKSVTSVSSFPRRLVYLDQEVILVWTTTSSDFTHQVLRSDNGGKDWKQVENMPKSIYTIQQHPFESNTVFVLSADKEANHIMSTDKGATWTSFTMPIPVAEELQFHANQPQSILYNGIYCERKLGGREVCNQKAYYTLDNFKTHQVLLEYTGSCMWGRSSKKFDKPSESSIFCTQWAEHARDTPEVYRDRSDLMFLTTENYFKDKAYILLEGGVSDFGITERFLVAAVKLKNSPALMMYVSTDGTHFTKSQFPFNDNLLTQKFTILDSTDNALVVDVLAEKKAGDPDPAYGTTFFSNSNGTYFKRGLEHTNRNRDGRVDFERIQSHLVEGIIFANTLDNFMDVPDIFVPDERKKLVSSMSFDNGANWRYLRPPSTNAKGDSWGCKPASETESVKKECALHLHSVTHLHNVGRVLSTGSAPGFLMGVGTVGSWLGRYEQGSTFFSADGGLTWKTLYDYPCKYEILGSGSILFVVPDDSFTDTFFYSLNRGESWQTVNSVLINGRKWRPKFTDVDEESLSLKMIMFAELEGVQQYYLVHFDFTEYLSGECQDSDFEEWKPGKEASKVCLLGAERGFKRKKANSKCIVKKLPKDLVSVPIPCACTEADYECDYAYKPKSLEGPLECVAINDNPMDDQPYDCKPGTKYMAKPVYRRIPGDLCTGPVPKFEDPIEKVCKSPSELPDKGTVDPPENRDPQVRVEEMLGLVTDLRYFPDSTVVLAATQKGVLYRSGDEGASWKKVDFLPDKAMLSAIVFDPFVKERAFLLMRASDGGGEIWYSTDRFGSREQFKQLKLPLPYNQLGVKVISFHPKQPDWLLFVGGVSIGQPDEHTKGFVTSNLGNDWVELDSWVTQCAFAHDLGLLQSDLEKTVYCTAHQFKSGPRWRNPDNPIQLKKITMDNPRFAKVVLDKVIDFYGVANELMAAVEYKGEVRLKVANAGNKYQFEDVVFPPNMVVKLNGFTLLESKEASIALDVGESFIANQEYGNLFVSDSKGTRFSRSLQGTNRNAKGMVDFERVQGVDGVIIANKVTNFRNLGGSSTAHKTVASLISFDNGATWKYLNYPRPHNATEPNPCNGVQNCGLHLHGRVEYDSTSMLKHTTSLHSNPNVPGLIIGVGNIGSALTSYTDGDVFMSRDAGKTWNKVRTEAHRWAFGDHGGLIVLVNDETATDYLVYSWDFGYHWARYKFSPRPVRVQRLVSEPSGTGSKFIITGVYSDQSTIKTVVAHVDFTDLIQRRCNLDELSDKNESDFEKWTPLDGCFLGQKKYFWRRKRQALCRIDKEFKPIAGETSTCPCTKEDYECDVAFWRNPDTGMCQLLGMDPDRPVKCTDTYPGSSGYRKIAMSSCQGEHEEYNKKVDRPCDIETPAGDVYMRTSLFDSALVDYFYYKSTSTVVFRDTAMKVYKSRDHGRTWQLELDKDKNPILATMIQVDDYRSHRMFYITSSTKHYVSSDNGTTLQPFNSPSPPSTQRVNVLSTHVDDENYLLWTGDVQCDSGLKDECHTETKYSTDMGKTWNTLASYSLGCTFGRDVNFKPPPKDTIFCTLLDSRQGDQRTIEQVATLKRTSDFGKSWQDKVKGAFGFAIVENFMVAATMTKNDNAYDYGFQVSLDGETWKQSKFPGSAALGYTLVESSTGYLFLDAYVHRVQSFGAKNGDFGAMYRSDREGVAFTRVLSYTNRNPQGNVDFEKVQGISQIALANQVINPDDVRLGIPKKLNSSISFDDGETWQGIVPPKDRLDGTPIDCVGCSLHVHAYTDRHDYLDQFSSKSAPGLLMAVGNVGKSLDEYNDCQTYLSRDAGLSWEEVDPDANMFEFGNRGSTIVMVNDEGPTDVIKYTEVPGSYFKSRKLSALNGEKMQVTHIMTDDSGLQPYFVLFGLLKTGADKGKTVSVYLDFSKVWSRTCTQDDFEAWQPHSSLATKCFQGKRKTYYRQKQFSHCRIDENTPVHIVIASCDCIRDDFECDAHFELNDKNECQLIKGKEALMTECISGEQWLSTGYRKKAGNTCENGLMLDRKDAAIRSCGAGSAGGISFWGWFWILVVTCLLTGLVGWCFMNYKRFYSGGRIRLPLDSDDLRPANALSSATELLGRVGRNLAYYAMDGLEWTVDKVKLGYEFIADKLGRNSSMRRGYSALGRDPRNTFSDRADTPDLNDPLQDVDEDV